jgi:hypothetical protein
MTNQDGLPAPEGDRSRISNVLGTLRDWKELIILVVSAIAGVIAIVTFFVTKEELRRIQCQNMALIDLVFLELNGIKYDRQSAALHTDLEAYESKPNMNPLERRRRANIVESMESIRKQKSDLVARMDSVRDKLQKGECHTIFEKTNSPPSGQVKD